MALIEVCGKLIDTKVKFSGKPALDFAVVALEKEKARQKEEEKQALSIEYSQEYLSIKASQSIEQDNGVQDEAQKPKKKVSTVEVFHSKLELNLDLLV